MKVWIRRIGFVLAVALLVLSFINASWLAPSPRGYIKLIAHRGVSQPFDHSARESGACTAARIDPPHHELIDNTLPALNEAVRSGAQMLAIDLIPTIDGKIAVFGDDRLDCRTDGKGPVRTATMEQLRKLDAGHGYSADGGKTFPLRGTGVGQIPELSDVLVTWPDKPLLFVFSGNDPAEADRLAAALKAAGRDPVKIGDGFYGKAEAGPVQRARALFPKAWVFSRESAAACTGAYRLKGWLGLTPEECRGGTLMVPLNRQFAFAGWPDRLMARMHAVGGRVIITGPHDGPAGLGIDLPEEVGKIPASFTGYVWVEDIRAVGPALRPGFNKRNDYQEERLAKALEARRKARD